MLAVRRHCPIRLTIFPQQSNTNKMQLKYWYFQYSRVTMCVQRLHKHWCWQKPAHLALDGCSNGRQGLQWLIVGRQRGLWCVIYMWACTSMDWSGREIKNKLNTHILCRYAHIVEKIGRTAITAADVAALAATTKPTAFICTERPATPTYAQTP